MEFRRAEIKKIYRHVEHVSSSEDVKTLLQALYQNNLRFKTRLKSVGVESDECSVMNVKDDRVDIFSAKPIRCRHVDIRFSDIDYIEVISTIEIVTNEIDNGGRWARII